MIMVHRYLADCKQSINLYLYSTCHLVIQDLLHKVLYMLKAEAPAPLGRGRSPPPLPKGHGADPPTPPGQSELKTAPLQPEPITAPSAVGPH